MSESRLILAGSLTKNEKDQFKEKLRRLSATAGGTVGHTEVIKLFLAIEDEKLLPYLGNLHLERMDKRTFANKFSGLSDTKKRQILALMGEGE